jgi:hypothetical protein
MLWRVLFSKKEEKKRLFSLVWWQEGMTTLTWHPSLGGGRCMGGEESVSCGGGGGGGGTHETGEFGAAVLMLIKGLLGCTSGVMLLGVGVVMIIWFGVGVVVWEIRTARIAEGYNLTEMIILGYSFMASSRRSCAMIHHKGFFVRGLFTMGWPEAVHARVLSLPNGVVKVELSSKVLPAFSVLSWGLGWGTGEMHDCQGIASGSQTVETRSDFCFSLLTNLKKEHQHTMFLIESLWKPNLWVKTRKTQPSREALPIWHATQVKHLWQEWGENDSCDGSRQWL